MNRLAAVLLALLTAGCAALLVSQLDQRYGPADSQNRAQTGASADYLHTIKPIIESRCVVCHGCYDAPCQLKLESHAGLERGANPAKVYDGTRLLAANLTRLFEDAQSTGQWRDKGFFPVLNERAQTEAAHQASVLYRMLALKQQHPLPSQGPLSDAFDFSLDRNQQCPTDADFDEYARRFPLAGMPYGLPGLAAREHQLLSDWVSAGARGEDSDDAHGAYRAQVQQWENFLNGHSLKEQLVARYIFEHLYLANLHFDQRRVYFRLVRSASAPGEPVLRINSRRPFDDPDAERVYYRLIPMLETVVAKNHLPYRLDPSRMQRWQQLFFEPDYPVTALPDYRPENSANPFKAFRELPLKARYRFMLDEAQYTIGGFIKGPVCRGQTALNVINDQFWVFFADPDYPDLDEINDFLVRNADQLNLPAERDSSADPLAHWLTYSRQQSAYLAAQDAALARGLKKYGGPSLEMIWQGDGINPNAALTVFRHFDSATVVQGLVGQAPKTAWVITYPLLERIHYLLVAGFDVYGNVGHQLLTRTYMDFLRMEGERNFLMLLPRASARRELAFWYRGAHASVADYFAQTEQDQAWRTRVNYQTDAHKTELLQKLSRHLDGVRNDRHNPQRSQQLAPAIGRQLASLEQLSGAGLQWLPDASLLLIEQPTPYAPQLVTLLRNKAHKNITSLLLEDRNLLPGEDTLTLAWGVLTQYPNALFHIRAGQLDAFAQALAGIGTAEDYSQLRRDFGILRNAPAFWAYSDRLHQLYQQAEPVSWGWLDYNRLSNP